MDQHSELQEKGTFFFSFPEASEYPQHDSLTNHYHISHCAGCAVLFDEDTFCPDVRVSSVYIHDSKMGHQIVREGEAGWVFQAVVSRAAFRRVLRNGKWYFTMMSLYARKRGIAKNMLFVVRTVMHLEQVDLVAGNFNGARWRRSGRIGKHRFVGNPSSLNQRPRSTSRRRTGGQIRYPNC